jgi:ABC-2 type transport system ATP-binding protein
VITARNLTHRYGERVALDKINFTAEPSCIHGFLGPNGGGKSTLFKILTTIMQPTEGTAVVAGYDVRSQPFEVRRKIGVVFQTPSLDDQLTVHENLLHQGHLYGLRGSSLRARIDLLLEQFTLTDRRLERAKTLSGGLKRRAEVAKSLLHQPDILLLDEPSTGLDPAARRDLITYLKQLREEENLTCLITTHLMDEADECDRLTILNEGQIVAAGTPESLKNEIGGEVITIMADNPNSLVTTISNDAETDENVTMSKNGTIRIESANGQEIARNLWQRHGETISSITIGRPALDDVFFHATGRSFQVEDAETKSK